MQIDKSRRAVLDWIDAHSDETIRLLEKIVNIDSGSYHKAGVDAVAATLRNYLEGYGVDCEMIAIDGVGDVLRATIAKSVPEPAILFMGHRDTVFGRGEATRRPFEIRDGRAYGPGVADMKAGLVMNAVILAGLSQCGGAPARLVGLFTGDEEIGSGKSRPIIEDEARRATTVFNSEPGRPNGNVVTGRKGGVFLRCKVHGKAAHSGVNFSDGVSAIEEMARKVQAWHRLTGTAAGLTVNVGLLTGGQSVNSVAPLCISEIDVRYVQPQARDEIVQAIQEIALACSVRGTSGEIEITGEFLPLVQTDASRIVLESYLNAARAVGFEAGGEFTGSCADSGFSAAVGTPTLCGVGPVGGKAHTSDEYIELPSLDARAKALALLTMNLNL
jgi:glutamate carboxypeptidase